ncbi:MAG: hypothetical protein V8Q30_02540 [Acutalibacteraceae bacterium]
MDLENIQRCIWNLSADLPAAVAAGEIEHLHIHTQRRELTAQLRFANVLEKSVLLQVQAQLRTALQLGRVLLLPRYPADQLTVAYLPSLADTLRAAGKHINGFFDGATAELAGDHLTISLAHGGYEWLERENCCPGDLRDPGTGVRTADHKLEFTGVLDLETIRRSTARPWRRQRQPFPRLLPARLHRRLPVRLLPRTAAMAAGTEAAMETAAGTVRAADAGATAVAGRPKAAPIRFDASGLPFQADEMTVIMGKPIGERPIPLSDAMEEEIQVTVWGDVFQTDKHVTRDETKVIYKILFTDYQLLCPQDHRVGGEGGRSMIPSSRARPFSPAARSCWTPLKRNCCVCVLIPLRWSSVHTGRIPARKSGWNCICIPICPPWTA